MRQQTPLCYLTKPRLSALANGGRRTDFTLSATCQCPSSASSANRRRGESPHRTRAMARTAHRGKHPEGKISTEALRQLIGGVSDRRPAAAAMVRSTSPARSSPGRSSSSRASPGCHGLGDLPAGPSCSHKLPSQPAFSGAAECLAMPKQQPNRPAQNSLPFGSASPVQWVVKSLRHSTRAPTETEPPVMRGPVDHDDRRQSRPYRLGARLFGRFIRRQRSAIRASTAR